MHRLFALACVLCLPAGAQTLQVREHTLSNGMRLLIHQDHDVPNIALYFFYKIGSRNERPGITGISHYFEHMMFNGAKKYGPKQFDIQMERAGGRNNAYTSRDVTVYTNWFAKSALELMFDMESDRIRDLSFDPKIVESERGVVYSERRTGVDNNPAGALAEQVDAAAYTAHPYQWPVIGWASDIEAWTMEDLKAHFRMGYAPNNCVVVVSGDVTESEILALAKKYLEPIPRQEPPPPIRTQEPPQPGERRIELRRPASLPLLRISYHVGRTADPDDPAIRVLTNVLAGGRSSRLYRRLVERDQLVLNVNAFKSLSLDPGQLTISMQVRSGAIPAAAEKALYEELDHLVQSGITADELNKARNALLADHFRTMKTSAGKANLIGNYDVFHGGWSKVNEVAQGLESVSAEDVQKVAAKYLRASNRTVGTLIPETVKETRQ
jgi:zinc protease